MLAGVGIVCGVYGIVDREGIRESDLPVLAAMGELLEHAGPLMGAINF